MAFIEQNEEDELQQGQGGQAPLVGGGSQQVAGAQGGTGGPAGRGGSSGGWVNIQNYLSANAGDTGSAQALDKQVSGQFDQERNKFQGDSSAFLQDAQGQVDKAKVSNEDADKAIKSAGSLYNYGEYGSQGSQQPDEYKSSVDAMRGALTNQYSGPKDYTYGFSNETQETGDALKNNSGFDKLMGSVYSNTAQRPLTTGQFELQKQLDVNNEALVNKRQQLAGGYDQLVGERDKTVTDTTASLGGLEKTFRENQNRLRDYLSGQANTYDQNIGKAESDARAAYQNTFNSGRTGTASIGYDVLGQGGWEGAINTRRGIDAWGNDLTWKQLQNEANNRMYNWSFGRAPLWMNSEPEFNRRQGMLDNFYGQQDQQYANTADQEERFYNTIQDFLNSDAERKKQGFNVRG
jgi:hypothetical protein